MSKVATPREFRTNAASIKPPPRSAARSIDPLKILRRSKFALIVAAITGGVLGTGAFFALREYAPLYTGQVLFEVTGSIQSPGDIGAEDITNESLVSRIASTEAFVVTSRDVLTDAVNSLEIEETQWHKRFKTAQGSRDTDAAVAELELTVSAKPVRGTNLFSVSWSAPDARDVPIVLNNIERAYIARREAAYKSVFNNNLALYRAELSQANRDMETLSDEIKLYIQDKGLTNLNDLRYTALQIALENLSDKLGDATAAYTSTQTTYQQTAAKLQGTMEPTAEDLHQVQTIPEVRSFESEILTLSRELRVALEKFNPSHPMVGEINRRMDATTHERDQLIQEKLRLTLNAKLKILSDEQERLRKQIESLEADASQKSSQLQKMAADYSQYEAMSRRREHLESSRDGLVTLIREVRLMQLRADASRVKTAQKALLPREMSFPKPEVIIPLGAILCVGLTLGIIFLREFTDQRVKSASDLAIIPGANVLGSIPELEEDPTRVEAAELAVRHAPNSVIAEAYRQVTAAITRAMDRDGLQMLVLIGGHPGAGTTTIATNLAAAASSSGKRVLLVDANFRRPRILDAMGLPNDQSGLGDLLAGSATLADVIVHDDFNVDILPPGTPPNRVFERLSNTRFSQLIAELRASYDLVIFDAPPAVVAGDALILANKVDAAAIIVRANQEQRGLVARLMHQIGDARCELLGLVLNRPRGTAGGYFKKNYATMAEYNVQDA